MKRNTGLQKITKMAVAFTLAASIAVTSVSPSYAAPKNPKASVKVIKKPTISKSSALYKELDKGLFDYEYYKANNPDVVAALGSSRQALLNHFLNYGIYEGRQPNSDFNVNAYSSAYTDLQSAFNGIGNDYQVILNYYTHYVNYGRKEGREITTVAEANAAGITVTKVGTDTPLEGQNGAAPAPAAPRAVAVPAPAPAPAPVITPAPAPAPRTEVTPAPETKDEPAADNNEIKEDSDKEQENISDNVSSEPEVTPSKPEVTPSEPEVTPSKPEVTPSEPEVTPTEPEVTPSEPEVTPSEPEVTPTEPEVTPSEPEITPTEPEKPAGHVHSYDNVTVTVPASKEAEGVRTFTCECGDFYEESIAKLKCSESEHGKRVSVRYISKPTCTEEGSYILICSECGDEVGETVTLSPGHTYDEGTTTIYPDDTTEGEITFTCTVCGYKDRKKIGVGRNDLASRYCNYGKHGSTHNLWAEEATCESAGLYVDVCDLCGEWLKYRRAYGHVYADTPDSSLAPTTTHSGYDYYLCTICGNGGKYVYYPKLECIGDGHGELVPVTGLEASCEEEGYYNLVCTECNEVVEKGDVIPATGHDFELIESDAPTYLSSGYDYYKCKVCGEAKYEYIDKLECPHANLVTNQWGTQRKTHCGDCYKTISVETVECAHGSKRAWECTQEITTEQDGIYTRTCGQCGEVVETQVFHKYKEYTVDIGNGETATIYGWLESDFDNTVIDGENSVLDHGSMYGQVFDKLNEYRTANGLNDLKWNWRGQAAADLRAIESAYYFDHERPNGTPWYTAGEAYMQGENLASGYSDADRVMTGWKNSEGHNRNMLYPAFKSVATSTFHRYFFNEGNTLPTMRNVWVQEFCYYFE